MHLHAHLHKCLYEFGPVRESGILCAIPSNKRFVELQLMKNFLKTLHVVDIYCAESVIQNLGQGFKKIVSMIDGKDRGTLAEMLMCQYESFFHMSSRNVDFCSFDWSIDAFITKDFSILL